VSGDLVRRPANVLASADVMGAEQFDNVYRMAKALAASGMFKDVTQAEQAFGRILLGADLGLTPTQALMSIDVVKGNVQVRAVRLAAWVRQHPDYDYAIVAHDEAHCVIDFYYKGEIAGQSSFSIDDAKAAKIFNANSPWGAHPRNMLFARAMSNGVRWYCPDLTGGIPVYTEADTFDATATATELAAGEGDGSEPGWEGIAPKQVDEIETLLTEAAASDFPGLADRATVQMRLNGQPEDVIQKWIDEAVAQLAAVTPKDADVVEGG
jgi:hypothetical protein